MALASQWPPQLEIRRLEIRRRGRHDMSQVARQCLGEIRDNLARIEDVPWVKNALDFPKRIVQRPILLAQIPRPTQAISMLATYGSFYVQHMLI